jgi:hypothetical protein
VRCGSQPRKEMVSSFISAHSQYLCRTKYSPDLLTQVTEAPELLTGCALCWRIAIRRKETTLILVGENSTEVGDAVTYVRRPRCLGDSAFLPLPSIILVASTVLYVGMGISNTVCRLL